MAEPTPPSYAEVTFRESYRKKRVQPFRLFTKRDRPGCMSDDEDHSTRMRQALDASGLSQAQVADRMGLGQSTISQWLKGVRRPDRETLEKFAAILGTSAVWLDYGEGQAPRPERASQRAAYQSELEWIFTKERPDGSRDFGNANIFSFKPTISAFVREVLQNVGDASPLGKARARFLIRRLRGNEVDGFLRSLKWSDFESHLKASIQSGQQVGAALTDGLRAVEARELILMEISDFGTTGLLGPDVGSGNFAALCRNNLDSDKSNLRAGGSYGLGKAVLWRMSGLSTVLFLSNLVEPAPDSRRQYGRFIARSELVWHELPDNSAFAGPGWFGVRDPLISERPISYWENEAVAEDLLFSRDYRESGTSIIVVAFRDPSNDDDQSPLALSAAVERAVSEHFWPALTTEALSVSVQVAEGTEIHRAIDVDIHAAKPEFADLLECHRRGEVTEQLREIGDVVRIPVTLEVPECVAPGQQHPSFTHTAYVLVRRSDPMAESSTFGQAQFFRGTGMVVFGIDLSRVLVGVQPFHAAVLCGTAAGNSAEDEWAERFLRASEPPAHNKWELTEKLQREYARGGLAALTRFQSSVRNEVKNVLTPTTDNPPDGPRDLASLFKLSEQPRPDRAPRFIVDSAALNEDGAWVIEGTIRVPAPGPRIVGRPFVSFQGETGSGTKVKWKELISIKDCIVEADTLVVASGKRTARFRGTTDATTYPVPVSGAAIRVDFRAVREEPVS